MKSCSELLHQFHDSFGNPAQFLRKVLDSSGQEDEQLSKPLILFHGVSLDLIELDGEEVKVVVDIGGIEGRIVVDFDADLL